MLEIRNLSFAYDDGDGRKVIRQMNLNIEDGTFVSIVGHSGCGKSTLLRLLAGLEQPIEGEIIRSGEHESGKTAVVFQECSLFPWLSAQKNISFYLKKTDKSRKNEAEEKAKEYLQQVAMSEDGGKYPFQLSGGMKKRVAIARAFATSAQLLLMDEPFGALDVSTRSQMQKLLLKVWGQSASRRTVIFVTHDIDEAMFLSERIIFIKDGKIFGDYDISGLEPSDEEYKQIRGRIEDAFHETY